MDLPLVTAVEPRDDSLVIAFRHDIVAKHPVLSPFLHSLQYRRSHTEVHICHPQGDDFVARTLIPLHAVRASSFYQFVEVIHTFMFLNYEFYELYEFVKFVVVISLSLSRNCLDGGRSHRW